MRQTTQGASTPTIHHCQASNAAAQERLMKHGSLIQRLAALPLALLPAVVFAVDTSSEAYKKGHSVGKMFGYLVLAFVVITIVRKIFKK
jgi:hypothetical protein